MLQNIHRIKTFATYCIYYGHLATLFGDNETLKDKLQAVQNGAARTTAKNEIFFQFFVCFEVTLYKQMYVTV